MKITFIRNIVLSAFTLVAASSFAKPWPGHTRGMGLGGWLTNYKRFNVLPQERRMVLTVGDFEHFDTFITERDVERIVAWGFDHVRIGFDQIVLEEQPGVWCERTFKKLDEFIGWCAKHKLNVVLNLHKAVGNYCDIKENISLMDSVPLQQRVIALWLEIERRYHNQPNLAFELLNEVRDVNPQKWNEFADAMVQAIRSKNPTRQIVIGSTQWNHMGTLKDLKIWDDANIIYTFHMYMPPEFTHQRGVLQADPLFYNRTVFYPDTLERIRDYRRVVYKDSNPYANETAFDKSFLAHQLAPAFKFAAAHPDKVLWLGEFGTIRHAPKASRVAYMRDVIDLVKSNGIPWCVWNYLSTPNDGNRFSLVDDDTRTFLSPELLRACLGE